LGTKLSNIFLHSICNCLSALVPALSSLQLRDAGQNIFYSARKASVKPLNFSGNSISHLHETQRKLCVWSISLTSIN